MTTKPLQFEPRQRMVMRSVHLTELGEVKVYEVMEKDLVTFEAATSEERNAIAFLTFFAGVFVPLIPTWPVGEASATKVGLHFGAAIATGTLTVFFLVQTIIKHRKRTSIVHQLRGTTRAVRTEDSQQQQPNAA
mgnify:CR=1 FL=1